MATDIHDNRQRLENITRRIQASPSLSRIQKRDLLRFKDECFSKGLSAGRVFRYLHDAQKLAGWYGGSLKHVTKQDATALVAQIEQSHYAPTTKRDLKITLRKCVHFLKGTDSMPEVVSWIRPSNGVRALRIPEELLTPEDITKLVEAADHPRDRAFVSTLWESGCRIGEILGMKVRHVRPMKHGLRLHLDGKTGPRQVPIITSAPYLTEFLNHHPEGKNVTAPLWLSRTGKVLGYAGSAKALRTLAKKAGITKHIYPHLFRHSRATYLANFLTEAQMDIYFGWVMGSNMASVYVHLSGRDVNDAVLRLHGLKPERSSSSRHLEPRSCSRCETQNPATHRFCKLCGSPLSEEVAETLRQTEVDKKEAESVLDKLIDDPEVRALLDKKLKTLGKT